MKRSTRPATPQELRKRPADHEPITAQVPAARAVCAPPESWVPALPGTIIPKDEPSAALVRELLAKSGHTVTSAAEALGMSRRSIQRFVTDGSGWRLPSRVVLAALNVLSPPRGRRAPIPRRHAG